MESSRNWRGIFSRAGPQALVEWYRDHLGDSLTPDDDPPWQQQAGPTAFAPFEQGTRYFGDVGKQWMINFRVGDFDAMMRQLKAAGIAVELDPESYPNGRFARLHEPEGNPIALWQPAGRGGTSQS